MSNFTIVFRSEITENQTLATVKTRFAKQFKISEEKAENFFRGKPVILKKGLSEADAKKWQTGLQKLGLMTHIQPEKQVIPKNNANKDPAQTKTQTQSAPTQETNTKPSLHLQPHGGDLLSDDEQAKQASPVPNTAINTSHLNATISELTTQADDIASPAINTSHLQAQDYDALTEEVETNTQTISIDHLSLID